MSVSNQKIEFMKLLAEVLDDFRTKNVDDEFYSYNTIGLSEWLEDYLDEYFKDDK